MGGVYERLACVLWEVCTRGWTEAIVVLLLFLVLV